MKIVVLTGSAHTNGTSAYLAEQFISGAKEAGHEVFRFDAAFQEIHPCVGCDKCHTAGNGCVFKDDMPDLLPKLIAADAVVLVSPIYYYDINAQLKAVIDRFYSVDKSLHHPKKAVLMVTMADDTAESAEGALASFKGLTKFLGWEIAGTVVGVNCWKLDMLKKTDFPQQAYALGKSL